jgi:hypothetical protein
MISDEIGSENRAFAFSVHTACTRKSKCTRVAPTADTQLPSTTTCSFTGVAPKSRSPRERFEVLRLDRGPARPLKSFRLLSGRTGPHGSCSQNKSGYPHSPISAVPPSRGKTHAMRIRISDIDDAAIEGGRAVGENRRTGFRRRPHRRRKSFVDRNPAAEQPRHCPAYWDFCNTICQKLTWYVRRRAYLVSRVT